MPSTIQPRRRELAGLVVLIAAVVLVVGFVSTTDGPFRLRQQLTVVVSEESFVSDTIEVHENPQSAPPPTAAPEPTPRPLNVSLLHPRTPPIAPLVGKRLELAPVKTLGRDIVESTQFFAQHGRNESGVHYQLRNTAILEDLAVLQQDALLFVVVLYDNSSWGLHRTSADFFDLIANFTHPKAQSSLAILTSSEWEFRVLKREMQLRIGEYAQFSLLFRNDFKADGLTRKNRHDGHLQRARRGMLARYRNFALLSTLEKWHQHVVWLDADVYIIPPGLVTEMIEADRDILEPICLWGPPPGGREYDLNAWAGVRGVPGISESDTRFMNDYRHRQDRFVELDSVGGTMLYVKADIHRQGVVFPHYYMIGTKWDSDGYDGIETEGLCYAAHFLGYKCWGMPHDVIYHVAS